MGVNVGSNLFPATPADTIASYDAFDIAQGIGFVTYYGGRTYSQSGGVAYKLSPIAFYSDRVATSGGTWHSGTNFTKEFSGAFNVTFERPQLITGRSVVNIPIGPVAKSNASNKAGAVGVVSIFKMDATGTQTQLFPRTSGAEVQTDKPAAGTRDLFKAGMSTVEVDIPTTHFKAGETLRLDVECWVRSLGADDAMAWIGHDPINRTEKLDSSISGAWRTGNTQLTFQVPYKVDV